MLQILLRGGELVRPETIAGADGLEIATELQETAKRFAGSNLDADLVARPGGSERPSTNAV